jgi:hypothetical protein
MVFMTVMVTGQVALELPALRVLQAQVLRLVLEHL